MIVKSAVEVPPAPPNALPKRHRWRRALAAFLVVLACLTLTVSIVGIWANRNFLDTDRFVSRVGPAVGDAPVHDLLTARLTASVMELVDPRALFEQALPERGQLLAVPLTNAVERFVRDRVSAFLGSDRFERLWTAAVTLAHGTAVDVLRGDDAPGVVGPDGSVELNLVPMVNTVLQRIAGTSPEVLGREVTVPDVRVDERPGPAIARIEDTLGVNLDEGFGQIEIYDPSKLDAARQGVRIFDQAVVVLPVVGLLFAAAALWLSPRRRRTLLQLSIGLVMAMAILRRVVFRVESEAASLPPRPAGRRAAADVVQRFLDPLLTFALILMIAMLVVAVVASVSGPYSWAVSFRRRAAALWSQLFVAAGDRPRTPSSAVTWVRAHRDALLVAGAGVGLLLLWAADVSWLGLFLVLGLVCAFEAVVYRIGTPTGTTPRPS